jgi:hypothetical protein
MKKGKEKIICNHASLKIEKKEAHGRRTVNSLEFPEFKACGEEIRLV